MARLHRVSPGLPDFGGRFQDESIRFVVLRPVSRANNRIYYRTFFSSITTAVWKRLGVVRVMKQTQWSQLREVVGFLGHKAFQRKL